MFSAHWNISYGGGGPAYLGPASQYLCSNCPVLTARWTTFTLNLSLTNHDVKNRSVYFTTTYIGCDPPFYLETTSPGDPFNIAPGATVVVSFTLWPDAATPGNRTFYGTIWTS